jgi:hypothetical protein
MAIRGRIYDVSSSPFYRPGRFERDAVWRAGSLRVARAASLRVCSSSPTAVVCTPPPWPPPNTQHVRCAPNNAAPQNTNEGGAYGLFAGKEVARALAIMSVKPEDCTGELGDATEKQLKTLVRLLCCACWCVCVRVQQQLVLCAVPNSRVLCLITNNAQQEDWEAKLSAKYPVVGEITSPRLEL